MRAVHRGVLRIYRSALTGVLFCQACGIVTALDSSPTPPLIPAQRPVPIRWTTIDPLRQPSAFPDWNMIVSARSEGVCR